MKLNLITDYLVIFPLSLSPSLIIKCNGIGHREKSKYAINQMLFEYHVQFKPRLRLYANCNYDDFVSNGYDNNCLARLGYIYLMKF